MQIVSVKGKSELHNVYYQYVCGIFKQMIANSCKGIVPTLKYLLPDPFGNWLVRSVPKILLISCVKGKVFNKHQIQFTSGTFNEIFRFLKQNVPS